MLVNTFFIKNKIIFLTFLFYVVIMCVKGGDSLKVSDTIRALLKMQGKKQADLAGPLGKSIAGVNNKFHSNAWSAWDLLVVARETNSKPGFLLSNGQFIGYDEAKERRKHERNTV